MPNINRWMTDLNKAGAWLADIENEARSEHFTHRTITDKPSTITISRQNGTTFTALSPQVVRLELNRIAPDNNIGPAAREHRANGILIGYRNHPTITDTDIEVGDRFAYDNTHYEIRFIFPETPGNVQAWLEVVR